MTTLDYAQVFETQIRPSRRLRRIAARAVLTAVFLVRPRVALRIWREHRRIA